MKLLSEQHIIDSLKNDYGMDVVSVTFLPWGADSNAAVYKAQTRDKSYFLKLKHGHHHDLGVAIVKLLHESGISQIISPINTIYGHPTHLIGHFTLLLYPFIEGMNGFEHPLTNEQWITLGKAIREVHDINVPSSIVSQVRREDFSPKWRNNLRCILDKIDVEPSGDEITSKIWKFIKENKKNICHLLDKAEMFCQKISNLQTSFVLCHSDIHGGNVLIDKNNTLYIVDWDEPIMAPKERDLMFIGGGIGNVWNQAHEEALFYQGYGKTTLKKSILAYYRHERIIVDIVEYTEQLLLSSAGGEERKIMYQHFMDMFAPRGVVEIALDSFITD